MASGAGGRGPGARGPRHDGVTGHREAPDEYGPQHQAPTDEHGPQHQAPPAQYWPQRQAPAQPGPYERHQPAQPGPYERHQPAQPGPGRKPALPQGRNGRLFAWWLGGIALIMAVAVPFNEFVYKPVIANIAEAIASEAGGLGQSPTDWNSGALGMFVALTLAQVALPCVGYLAAVAGITRRRGMPATIALVGVAMTGTVFSIMQASIRPRVNVGVGSRESRFAERFEGASASELTIIWQTSSWPIVPLLCCGVLVLVLAVTTWRQGKPPRRPRAAWPWLLPLPVIFAVGAAIQIFGPLQRLS